MIAFTFYIRILSKLKLIHEYLHKSKKLNITHATLLDQAFAHCPKSLTAALNWNPDAISIPVWLIILSDQLRIFGLLSFYLTNYLIFSKLTR